MVAAAFVVAASVVGLRILHERVAHVAGTGNQGRWEDLVPPQFVDKSLFLTAINLSATQPSHGRVTGITVPHHLLAVDFMAGAYRFASNGKYSQVLLLSPDHYSLGQTDVTVSESNFSTVFGTLSADVHEAQQLEQLPFVASQNFFYREHGLGAEVPFIKYYFPDAKVTAVTLKETTPRAELEQVVDVLEKTLGENVLVVQSTDFSHYLTPANAEVHDEQTIKVLQGGVPSQVFSLTQPDNIDSIAAQYVQSRLQQDLFSSKMTILAHGNSQDYTTQKIDSTTSYIVQAYVK